MTATLLKILEEKTKTDGLRRTIVSVILKKRGA